MSVLAASSFRVVALALVCAVGCDKLRPLPDGPAPSPPAGWPSDVPMPPRTTIASSHLDVSLETPDAPEAVTSWYKQHVAGLTLVNEQARSLTYSSRARFVSVSATKSGTDQATTILLTARDEGAAMGGDWPSQDVPLYPGAKRLGSGRGVTVPLADDGDDLLRFYRAKLSAMKKTKDDRFVEQRVLWFESGKRRVVVDVSTRAKFATISVSDV